MKTALVIGGLDNTGGAGILADVKTFAAFGGNTMGTATAITVQNSAGVVSVEHVSGATIRSQIENIIHHFPIHCIKMGMLGSLEGAKAVYDALLPWLKANPIPVIIDPVFVSTSGIPLLDEEGFLFSLKNLYPLAELITPNIPEMELIIQSLGIFTPSIPGAEKNQDLTLRYERIFHSIRKILPSGILLKGGHSSSDGGKDIVTDTLFTGEELIYFSKDKIPITSTHGTGCTFASAICANLVKGEGLIRSVEIAEDYIAGAIQRSPWKDLSYGPVNQLWMSEDGAE